MRLATETDRFQEPVQNLSIVDLDDVMPPEPQLLHRIGRHHADFRVRRRRGGTHGIGVELHELTKTSRPRLLVAEHPTDAIAAIRFRQCIEMLRDIACERRGEIVAQRQPLLVIILKGEHAFVRSILVGKELAERIGIFDGRRLHCLESVPLVNCANALEHAPRGRNLGGSAIAKSAGQARVGLVGFLFGFPGLIGHYRATYMTEAS